MGHNHPEASRANSGKGNICPDLHAAFHLVMAMREVGAVATSAEAKKITKYVELARTHHVTPLAIETSGVFGEGLNELGR